jgi:hypothetical protein
METNKNNKEKDLKKKLDNFLTDNKNCEGEDCLIKDNQELVQREHKRIITSDGRQLLSEYTR